MSFRRNAQVIGASAVEQTAEPKTHLAPVAFDDHFDGNNPVSSVHLTSGVFLKVMVAHFLEGAYVCH
jgi:hypothetical protein